MVGPNGRCMNIDPKKHHHTSVRKDVSDAFKNELVQVTEKRSLPSILNPYLPDSL